jgi:hypothetical protein
VKAVQKTCLLLWGSSGAYGDDGSAKIREYKNALDLIGELATKYAFQISLVQYPGHPTKEGVTTGELNFSSALSTVLVDCARFEPEWIIGRSFGALLIPAVLGSTAGWIRKCKGAVMWGPGFKRFNDKVWGKPEQKKQAIKDYRKFHTHLASDFFDTLPEVESLVPSADSNLRFARGTEDKFNSTEDLYHLSRLHEEAQPHMKREVTILAGFDHTPTKEKLSDQQIEQYSKCLFGETFTTK